MPGLRHGTPQSAGPSSSLLPISLQAPNEYLLKFLETAAGCSDLSVSPDLSFDYPESGVRLGCLHDSVSPDHELGVWVSFFGRWLVLLDREHPSYLDKAARTGLTQVICTVLSTPAVSLDSLLCLDPPPQVVPFFSISVRAFAQHLTMSWELSIVLDDILAGLLAWRLWSYSSPGLAVSSDHPPDGLRPFPVACTVSAPPPVAVSIQCEVADQLSPLVLCDHEQAAVRLANFRAFGVRWSVTSELSLLISSGVPVRKEHTGR